MTKKLILLFCCLFLSLQFEAQNAIVIAGGNIDDGNFKLSYSIGQVAKKSTSDTNGLFNQGIQQPFEIYNLFSLSLDDNDISNFEIKAYPNPTVDLLTLSINNAIVNNQIVKVYDLNGKVILQKEIIQNETQIDFSQFNAGVYLFNVFDKNHTLIKAFKIIKNH
ncbi:T9SS type A sorting domain-containing protein [uncultured Winogradskyella sp.]|uniref:T9SS type A sorting domain-containing protein n=1 Tax=uncultured Winogradskyella sp. TaxID=395353 RepID=UPI0025E13C27|nr:T9SS type A sorting domain-containing protein [uncultured Winogradskyella sp.]